MVLSDGMEDKIDETIGGEGKTLIIGGSININDCLTQSLINLYVHNQILTRVES